VQSQDVMIGDKHERLAAPRRTPVPTACQGLVEGADGSFLQSAIRVCFRCSVSLNTS